MSNQAIELRSDTLTLPSVNMLQAVSPHILGDDCFSEDPSVAELEEYCASLFGKEAAVMLPTGTMSNQVALKALVQRGNEAICDVSYHLNFFEASQTADLSGVTVNVVDTSNGILTVDAIERAIDTRARWNKGYPTPQLIWLENTINGRGGKVVPLSSISDVHIWATARGMSVYMDGARVLNACVAAGVAPSSYAACTTAISVCFAKGLGAPMGSALMGSRGFIQEARRMRKWYGGSMHQSGVIASAALYALKHNVARLAEDHRNAARFARAIRETALAEVNDPESNIVIFRTDQLRVDADGFVAAAEARGVRLLAWRAAEVRAVFSLCASDADTDRAIDLVCDLLDAHRANANAAPMKAALELAA